MMEHTGPDGRHRHIVDLSEQVAGPGGPTAPEIAAIKAHAAFDGAVRARIDHLLGACSGSPVVNLLLNDRGKFVISVFCLGLHATYDRADARSGLTGERLGRACMEANVCSRGRALSVMALLRQKEHLMAAPAARDGRVRRLVPSPAMLALHRDRVMNQYRTAALVFPDILPVLPALDTATATVQAALESMTLLMQGWRLTRFSPGLTPLVESAATLPMLARLLAEGLDAVPSGVRPGEMIVPANISALAKSGAVSRKHVLKMLTLAEENGLVERPVKGGDRIILKPALLTEIENLYAIEFALSRELALRTARRVAALGETDATMAAAAP